MYKNIDAKVWSENDEWYAQIILQVAPNCTIKIYQVFELETVAQRWLAGIVSLLEGTHVQIDITYERPAR